MDMDEADALRVLNDATMDPEWAKTVNRVRAFIANGDGGKRALILLGLIMGTSTSGRMAVEDAIKMALVMLEIAPAERKVIPQ